MLPPVPPLWRDHTCADKKPPMLIRQPEPSEAPLVGQFYRDAPEYRILAGGSVDPDIKAQEFFTDAPPSCDPEQSHHLGLFFGNRLSGVVELSYGFPEPTDACLGLMLIGPRAQSMGHGKAFLKHAETLERSRAASRLYLAVPEANPRGRAFWEPEGFTHSGRSVVDSDTGHCLHRLMKPL